MSPCRGNGEINEQINRSDPAILPSFCQLPVCRGESLLRATLGEGQTVRTAPLEENWCVFLLQQPHVSTPNVDLAQFGVKEGTTLLLSFRKRAQR